MAKPKRTKFQIEQDRILLTELRFMKSFSLADCKRHLDKIRPYELSIPTIGRDCQVILKGMREAAGIDREALFIVQLAKLDKMEAELWEAWEASKQPTKKTSSRQEGERGSGSQANQVVPNKIVSSETLEHGYGDMAVMELIRKIHTDRSKLLGFIQSNSYFQQNIQVNESQAQGGNPDYDGPKSVYDLGDGVRITFD